MHLSPCGKRNRKNFQNFGFGPKTLARKWITTVFVQTLNHCIESSYIKNDGKNACPKRSRMGPLLICKYLRQLMLYLLNSRLLAGRFSLLNCSTVLISREAFPACPGNLCFNAPQHIQFYFSMTFHRNRTSYYSHLSTLSP